jgi:hypothetical protein
MRKYFSLSMLPVSAALGIVMATFIAGWNSAKAEIPDAIVAKDEIHIDKVHAEGVQVYECKATATGALVWQFREPVAVLIQNGKTVGKHYAGPHWDFTDGSVLMAKVVATAPAADANDIPLLKLEVTKRSGAADGLFLEVTTIQRVNTKGGVATGACSNAGALLSVPYTADYVFYRKLVDLAPAEEELPASY